MYVGERCSIKGIAGWKGRCRPDDDRCARDKLTRESKKKIARMVRLAIKRGAEKELRSLHQDPPRTTVAPAHYASSIDY